VQRPKNGGEKVKMKMMEEGGDVESQKLSVNLTLM